jgi:hypothetical protein
MHPKVSAKENLHRKGINGNGSPRQGLGRNIAGITTIWWKAVNGTLRALYTKTTYFGLKRITHANIVGHRREPKES